jgi:hypothetical protein
VLWDGCARSPQAPRGRSLRLGSSAARRAFLQFLIAVVALHAVAIVLYYLLGIQHAARARQQIFAWVWMAATVLVIFVGLGRIKRARRVSRAS